MTRQILFGLLCFCLFGCSHKLTLTSTPSNAVVKFGKKSLGSTPVTIDEDEIGAPNAGGGFLYSIEKEGFKKVWLWKPEGLDDMSIAINISRFRLDTDSGKESQSRLLTKEYSELADQLLAMQKRLFDNKLDQLEKTASKNKEILANLGSYHYLKGVEALKKNAKDEAKKHFEKAVSLAPTEPEFVVLLNHAQGKKP